MTINQIKCDGCGKVEDITFEHGFIKLPEGWSSIQGNHLCPTCVEKVEEFIQSLNK